MQPSPYGSVPPYGGLRPLGVGEILDNAIQVYRRNFVALVLPDALTTDHVTMAGCVRTKLRSVDGAYPSPSCG